MLRVKRHLRLVRNDIKGMLEHEMAEYEALKREFEEMERERKRQDIVGYGLMAITIVSVFVILLLCNGCGNIDTSFGPDTTNSAPVTPTAPKHDYDYAFHLYADYNATESPANTYYTIQSAVIVPPIVLALNGLVDPFIPQSYSNAYVYFGDSAYCYYETNPNYIKNYLHLQYCNGIGYSGDVFPSGTRVRIVNNSVNNAQVVWCWYYKNGVLDPMEAGGNYTGLVN